MNIAGVCVVGSLMMDLTVRVRRRPDPGETVVGLGLEEFLGGKGFNQAIAAARSGAVTSLIGRVGNDEWGTRFRACLRREGVGARHLVTDGREGTGVGMPIVDETGENAIVIVPRANAGVTVADIEAARSAIVAADVLLLQLELPLAPVVAAARIAREAGARVVLNPAPAAADLSAFAGLIDVVVPNEGEALRLSGLEAQIASLGGDDPEALDAVARALHHRTGADVVLTLGAAGAFVFDRGVPARLRAHEVTTVDSVAAGDVFCGALGATLASGASLIDAAAYANAAAALAVTRRGAEPSIPTRHEVQAMVDAPTPTPASAPAGTPAA
jgi:ribokinase